MSELASGDRVAAIVKTVLYEGYALYPYRPSALKNQKRFAFGAVYPKPWATRAGEPYSMRAECVFEAATAIDLTIGFLALHRGGGATEHAVRLGRRASCEEWSELRDTGGLQLAIAGAIVAAGEGLWRVSIELENLTPLDPGADREAAMDVTFASTHVVVRATGGTAVSAIDPPRHAATAIANCRTLGCYPIVVARDTILASPIVLPDFPEIADRSPGDFFDGTEMDEMLTLRVLTLTDDEKREAAASDPRIAALLARTEARGFDETAHLHGTTRIGDSTRAGMASTAIGPRVGTRVRLQPRGRADAFDVILAGKLATIAGVDRDLDGRAHYAVTIDDDPGADLGAQGMPGHRFYFRADELEVLP